jgi:hypothetical protein
MGSAALRAAMQEQSAAQSVNRCFARASLILCRLTGILFFDKLNFRCKEAFMSIHRRNLLTVSASAAAVPFLLRTMRPQEALATTSNPNQATFDTAWQAFNSRHWRGPGSLASCLADQVTLVKINTNESVKGTRDDIIRYLKRNVDTDGEMFDPTVTGASENWSSNNMVVSGYADWADHDNQQGTTTHSLIFYRFRFNQDGLIDRMFGSKDQS